jgi:hypothetical protein
VSLKNPSDFFESENNTPGNVEEDVNDSDYWQEILEGQLRNVQNKIGSGVISFVDPNAESGEPTE